MKIETAYSLQSKFISGLQITGEDFEGNLEWIGDNKQWKRSEEIEEDMQFEPFKDYSKYNA